MSRITSVFKPGHKAFIAYLTVGPYHIRLQTGT